MSNHRKLAAAIAGLALVVTIPAWTLAQDGSEPQGLTGVDRSLTSITADGVSMEVPAEIGATLRLEAGQATGSGGCNRFFGSYVVDGQMLTFGPLGMTQMLCQGPAQDVEDAYLAALGSVAYWALADDGTLSLQDADQNEVLAFSAGGGGIEGTTWLLREQAVDGSMSTVPKGVLVSLRMADGVAGGNGGCNRYNTSYTLEGSSLTFGPVASTLMACPDPAGSVEAAYLANLAAVAAWTSDGSALTLSDASGASLLSYEAAPEATVVGSWVAQGINNGAEAVVSSPTTSAITAEFTPDGDLTGFDGCNNYFTTYTVDGDAIDISDAIGSTQMACPSDELAEQSQQYYMALAASTTWMVGDAGDLQLRDDGGSLQVNYSPADG